VTGTHRAHVVVRVLDATRRAGRNGGTLSRLRHDAETGMSNCRDILATLEAAGFVRYDQGRYIACGPRPGDVARLDDLIDGYKHATSRPGRKEHHA